MKSKPSLRNTATRETSLPILPRNFFIANNLVIFFLLLAVAFGCSSKKSAKNFYTLEQIPSTVEKLAKEEFNLNVKASLAGNSLWVYLPAEKLLDSGFNLLPEASVNFDHASLVIGRVLLNSLNPPEFYVLASSDIKSVGLDYISYIYTKDLKRYYYSRISRGEFSKRKVTQFKLNLMALGDVEGRHISPGNINMAQFLAAQLKRRIDESFKEVPLKNAISVKLVDSNYENNRFTFNLDLAKTGELKNIDIIKETLKIIAFVLREYDFRDFSEVSVSETATGKNITLSQKALFEDFK